MTTSSAVRISGIPGAALLIEETRWHPDQAAANLDLLLRLGELCGRLQPSGIGGYSQVGTPESWLKLADVDEGAIRSVVRRIRRAHPDWDGLDAGDEVTTLGQLDHHFGLAQRRRDRER